MHALGSWVIFHQLFRVDGSWGLGGCLKRPPGKVRPLHPAKPGHGDWDIHPPKLQLIPGGPSSRSVRDHQHPLLWGDAGLVTYPIFSLLALERTWKVWPLTHFFPFEQNH